MRLEKIRLASDFSTNAVPIQLVDGETRHWAWGKALENKGVKKGLKFADSKGGRHI